MQFSSSRGVSCDRWQMARFSATLHKVILFNALFLLIACGSTAPTPTPTQLAATATPDAPLIVAMGDSLTEGLGVDSDQAYPAQLERKLRDDGYTIRVINAGVSGETSSGALERVNWVTRLKPQIVILATGGNDSLRGIDTDLTRSNLAQIVNAFKAQEITVVLAGMQTVQNMGTEYTTAFQAIYPLVAQENELILIPFFLEGVGGNPQLNQADAIHPTAEGYTVVVETIYPYIQEALKQRGIQ